MRNTLTGALGLALALTAGAGRAAAQEPVKDDKVRPAVLQPDRKVEAEGDEHVLVIDYGLWREAFRFKRAKGPDGKTLVWTEPKLVEDRETEAALKLTPKAERDKIVPAVFEPPADAAPAAGATVEIALKSGGTVKGTIVREDPEWVLVETADSVVSVRHNNIVMLKVLKNAKAPAKPGE